MKGILLVDKPQDWTSSDVVAKLRGVLHEKRIGHGGTLDPLATGLLVLMIGRATRASDDIMGHDKTYHAMFRPGVTTDTQDITGTVLREAPESLTREDVARAAERFLGEICQIPPMYSAIKVGGKKLYEIARKGGEIERRPRPVTVYQLDAGEREERDFPLEIHCSSGTYIRTICHDLGEALGCGGCMAGLRRTEVGNYTLAEAHPLAELLECTPDEIEAMLLPADSVYAQYPAYTASAGETDKLLHGNPVPVRLMDGLRRVYSPDGEFLLLGEVKEGLLKIEKSFFDPLPETCGHPQKRNGKEVLAAEAGQIN